MIEYNPDAIPDIKLADKKIFHGDPAFANHLSPMKHQWAYDMSDDALNNFWKHAEINMSPDMLCFLHRLSISQQSMFVHVVSALSSMDLVIGRNIAIAIYGIITCAEIEIFMDAQIAMEGIHKKAYHVMLQGIRLPEEYVYSRYREVPTIAAKFAFAKKYSDLIGKDSSDMDNLRGLVFWYAIAEYLWFYVGFAPLFALSRNNLMIASSDQVRFIMRDEELHGKFGIRLILEIQNELSIKLDDMEIINIFNEAVDLETAYAYECLVPIPGFTPAGYVKQVNYIARQRLLELEVSKTLVDLYYPKIPCPFPWLDEQTGALNAETAFFERRNKEYSLDPLNWENDDGFDKPIG